MNRHGDQDKPVVMIQDGAALEVLSMKQHKKSGKYQVTLKAQNPWDTLLMLENSVGVDMRRYAGRETWLMAAIERFFPKSWAMRQAFVSACEATPRGPGLTP